MAQFLLVALAVSGGFYTTVDVANVYVEEGPVEAVKQLAFDGLITVIGGVAIKAGTKATFEIGGGIYKNIDVDQAYKLAAKHLKLPTRTSAQILTKIDNYIDLTDGKSGHVLSNHKSGIGKSGKTEFPSNWSDERVIHQISDVATDPKSVKLTDNRGTPYALGTRDGIEIRVNFHPVTGKITTGYPTNVTPNP